jgi:hypothetical protein
MEKNMTLKCGLFVRLEAKLGKERAVKDFLVGGLDLTNREGGHASLVCSAALADDVRRVRCLY